MPKYPVLGPFGQMILVEVADPETEAPEPPADGGRNGKDQAFRLEQETELMYQFAL